MALKDKVAVVTGAGSGIGRAICLRLAEEGVVSSVWDVNMEGAEETVRMVKEAGSNAIACAVDVSQSAQIAAAAARTRSELGPVAILVNNAGISLFEKLSEVTEEKWDHMMAVNLKGPYLCAQTFVPDMVAAGWGRIVNISSSAMQQGSSNSARYAASKGGVLGLTKALAKELAVDGITVNNIPPGLVDTPRMREVIKDVDAVSKLRPMQRHGEPEDIAEACAYLVSERSSYITGQTISVNGGYYMM